MRFTRRISVLLPTAMLLCAGCLKTELSIELHDDGSATVTERIRFSSALMDLNREVPGALKLEPLLERKAAEERMKQMGKGVRLASHKVDELPAGARESVVVYKIPDAEELILVNPFPSSGPPKQLLRLRFGPIYKFVHSWHRVGALTVNLTPVERPKPRPRTDEEPPPPPTPLELQILRNLRPMFADMMDGLELKVDLTATRPVCSGHVRNLRAGTKTITLLSFTAKDLDAYGGRFLENEELMLSLLRLELDADIIADHVQGFAANHTLPVFRCRKPYASRLVLIWPTKALFTKYYHGRPKSQGGDMPDK